MKGECCLVLLHGSGSDGDDIASYLGNVPLPDFDYRTFAEIAKTMSITLITPTAATRAFSAMGGELCNVWFDRSADFIDRGMDDSEDTMGINSSLRTLELELTYLNDQFEHVFFGGFSMGGGLALHVLRKSCFTKLRGVFSMGSFLTEDSALLTKPLNAASKVPVLMMHGERDPLIRCDWGRKTAANLLLRGVDVQFRSYKGVLHDMDPRELADLLLWVRDVRQQLALRSDAKIAPGQRAGNSESSSKKCGDWDDECGEGKEAGVGKAWAGDRNSPPDVAIPYTIEPAQAEGSDIGVTTAALLRVRFFVPAELISVVAGRPVLACGSTFDVLEDRPNGVQVLLQSSDPHSTARQIGLRLQARVSGGSATLNPCPVS